MQYKIAPAVEEEQDKALLDLYDTDISRQLLSSYRSDAIRETQARAQRLAQRFDTYTEPATEDQEEWDILIEKVEAQADAKSMEVALFKTTALRIQQGWIDNI